MTSPASDPVGRPLHKGRLWGIVLGLAGTTAVYLGLLLKPYDEPDWIFWLWLSPLVLGVGLMFIPRLRPFGLGMTAGVALAWLVAVPACVVLTLNTVQIG